MSSKTNHSSKNQRVFIELHDYAYYHSPSEVEDSDKRFIGRERLIEKFRSVLTDTAKKSGCYLVAGYRGMGKTSFVNKVLETIYKPSTTLVKIYRWAMLVFVFALLTIGLTIFFEKYFTVQKSVPLYETSIAAIIIVISIIILLNLFKVKKDFLVSFINREIYSRYPFKTKKSSKYARNIFLYFISLVIILLWFSSFSRKGNDLQITINKVIGNLSIHTVASILRIYFFFFMGISFLQVIAGLIRIWRFEIKGKSDKGLFSEIVKKFTGFVNYSNRINIKMNLGYAELKERDILRLIARNIRTGYSDFRHRLSTGLIMRIGFLFICYMMVKTVYEIPNFREFNSTLRQSIGLTTALPSQHDIFLDDHHYYLGKITDELRKSGGFSLAEYQVSTRFLNEYYKKGTTISDLTFKLRLSSLNIKYLFDFFNSANHKKNGDSDEIIDSKINTYFLLKKKLFGDGEDASQSISNSLTTTLNDPTALKILFSEFPNLEETELYSLIRFWSDCPQALAYLTENNLTLELLLDLKRMKDLNDEVNALKPLKAKILISLNYIDYAFYSGYYYMRELFSFGGDKLIPYSIDYLFIIYCLFFLVVLKQLAVLLIFKFTALDKVKRKIEFLNDLIDANVVIKSEQGLTLPKSSFLFSRSRNKDYQQIDERELEKYLIELIYKISHRPLYSFRAQFVFVFDELDKIEPRYEETDKENGRIHTNTYDATRIRQQTILELLSNLKYFLSTAKAKFIFITGREMYDASLADISDRNFRIGSIFHDIYYLNSFFTDLCSFGFDDITSRSEQFVCQFLFPPDYPAKDKNLKYYNQYLQEKVEGFNEKNLHGEAGIIARQKREKVIHLLQQFIIYLNHVSTGAPSKLTSYFENYIITREQVHKFKENSVIAGENTSHNLFLFFDYYHQYKIGLINYLLTPFNFSINRNIRNYSDKLVVSASFLHDHLLKFHRNAFSWRDLEATPEMVDVNKNPELREFLENVIQFMLDTQIQRIVNGLYDFKYPKRIAQEIAYLSHISEDASASFNFTLDESLAIKQHFKDQYINIRKMHVSGKENIDYIYSLSSLSLTLADLCFYDEDLGEAITFYLEAVQAIRNVPFPEISLTQVALLTRNMLKLGHALEKRHTYDVAYLTYAEISDSIRKIIIKAESEDKYTWLKELLENVHVFCQPVLSKLYLTEKISFNGITNDDINKTTTDFQQILEHLSSKNKSNLQAEFYKKVGDILYYKNFKGIEPCIEYCPMANNKCCLKHSICPACASYNNALIGLVEHIAEEYKIEDAKKYISNKEISDLLETIRKRKLPLNASIYAELAIITSDIGDTVLCCFLDLLESEKEAAPINPVNFFDGIARYYDHSAFFFRLAGDHKGYSYQNLKMLYLYREISQAGNDELIEILNTIPGDDYAKKALKGIYAAYEQIHVYEITRFKNIFNNDQEGLLAPDISLNRISLNAEIEEITLLSLEIELLNSTYKSAAITDKINGLVNPYSLNTNMYNRYLKLRLKALSNEKAFVEILSCEMNIEVGNDSTMAKYLDFIDSGRTGELSDLEFYITDTIFCYFEIIKILNTFDSSFSLNHTLQMETHEKLYIWSVYYNTYLSFYDLKGRVAIPDNVSQQTWKVIKSKDFNPENLVDRLGSLIEPDNLPFISHFFQGEKALREYYAARETHSQGKAYKSFIEKMYYLNDDYNDRLFHFSIALERFKLKTKKLNDVAEKMKKITDTSDAYKIESYKNTVIVNEQ